MKTQEIWKKIQQGDRTTYEYIFKLHYKSLLIYTAQFTKDSHLAEDIVQDMFMDIWERREVLNISKSLKSYLYTYCYNAYIETIRQSKRDLKLLDNLTYEALQNKIETEQFKQDQILKKLDILIKDLPPRCKEILILSKMKGYEYKDIAVMLDISVKTVESQMRISFKKIREGFNESNMFLWLLLRKKFSKSHG